MMDPVTLLLVLACVRMLTRVVNAAAYWLLLRARAQLVRAAAALPARVELTEHDPEGAGWLVRTGPANGRCR